MMNLEKKLKNYTKNNEKVYFKFGIYRKFMSRWGNKNNLQDVPAQVFYFDEARIGKTKEKVVGKLPPLK